MKNEMNEIPTPETDAEWQSACCSGKSWYRIAEMINDHARDLERRLTVAREALWESVESSPREGVVFLAFVPHEQGGFAFSAVWNTADRLLCMMSGDDFTGHATRWTSLPQFPTMPQ